MRTSLLTADEVLEKGVAQRIQKLLPHPHKRCIKLALENHGGGVTTTPRDLLRTVRRNRGFLQSLRKRSRSHEQNRECRLRHVFFSRPSHRSVTDELAANSAARSYNALVGRFVLPVNGIEMRVLPHRPFALSVRIGLL